MKKIYSILMLLSLVVVSACRKSDNATMPDGIVYLNQPHILKSVDGDPVILDTDPLSFASSVTVDLYFKESKKPDYLDLVVMKNGDAKNAKVIKGRISSYPATVELTGQQLTDLFGEAIVGGDSFDIGANYIEGGKTYLAFPEGGGAAYAGGVASQADASPMVRFTAICGFVVDENIGEYQVKVDGWGDYGVDAITLVKKIDDSTLALESAIPTFNDVILKVNEVDNTISIAKQDAGDTDVYGYEYGMLFMESIGGGLKNFINPCNGTITLQILYTVGAGSFGDYTLELKKVQ